RIAGLMAASSHMRLLLTLVFVFALGWFLIEGTYRFPPEEITLMVLSVVIPVAGMAAFSYRGSGAYISEATRLFATHWTLLSLVFIHFSTAKNRRGMLDHRVQTVRIIGALAVVLWHGSQPVTTNNG